MPQNNEEHWHLRKELSIGTIISLMLLTGSGFTAYGSLSEKITHIEDAPKVSVSQVARIEERQKTLQEDVDEIKQDVKRLPAIEQALLDIKEQIKRVSEEQ